MDRGIYFQQTEHDATLDQLLDIIREWQPDTNLDNIRRAYAYGKEAHDGQLRKSGIPYMQHPLSTAIKLADLGLDETTIIAGLLHDVPEDTDRTIEDVTREFGEEVAFLVEGVTKLGQLKYRGQDRYVENLRRMFMAMAQDARVIVVKFADRITNLQTLDALPPDKQRRIALESLEIYAPIANRLGMGELKGLLEDLAFPYVYPEEYKWLTQQLDLSLRDKEEFMVKFQNYLEEEFQKRDVEFISIQARRKHLYSLYKKLIKNNRDLSKIYDLVAIRVIVPSVAKCYETLGIVHEVCKPLKGRIKDYISQPKPNGYQSLHTTVFAPPQFTDSDIYTEIVEIQIRTMEMHQEAEFGIAAHWLYKEKKEGKKKKVDPRLTWMQQLIEAQETVEDRSQLLETLKLDFFQNYIFVFTPQGDVVELPEDATPVDFAYKIHSDLGDKCTGVKVNGQMGSLDQHLHSGDVVEIFVNPQRQGPSPDWLSFVKTNTARQHIRQYINKRNSGFFERLGISRKR